MKWLDALKCKRTKAPTTKIAWKVHFKGGSKKAAMRTQPRKYTGDTNRARIGFVRLIP